MHYWDGRKENLYAFLLIRSLELTATVRLKEIYKWIIIFIHDKMIKNNRLLTNNVGDVCFHLVVNYVET